MMSARIPVGEDDSVGNKLGEWITLRGEKHSNDLAGKQYSVGREILDGMLMVTSLGVTLMCWKC